MSVKVFVLGRPGSGKSTAAHYILELAHRRNYEALFVQDYDILYKMFLEDSRHTQFRPSERGGFDVCDYSVLDSALKQMEEEIENSFSHKQVDIVCIEFARSDYRAALKMFRPNFLHDAYFFFIDSDLEYCIRRVQERVVDPPLPDQHFVSEHVMRTYYNNSNWEYMVHHCKQEYALGNEIVAIRNDGLLPVFLNEVSDFAEGIFQRELVGSFLENRDRMHLFSLHEVDRM